LLNDLFFLNNFEGWVAASNGLLHTTDGGQHWYGVTVNGEGGLLTVFFNNVLEGWTANIEGKIFRTTDGGDNWTQQEQITHFPIKSVFSSGGDECWAVGQSGMILHLDDGLVSSPPLPPETNQGILAVYPNPATNKTRISFISLYDGTCRLFLYDVSGKLLQVADVGQLKKGVTDYGLETLNLNTGTYLLKLEVLPGSSTHRKTIFSGGKLIIK
jgi:hypothetical protein